MKNLLFVDDDTELLGGLRARLYRRRREWNMRFVASGDAALEALEQQPADVIVTDVRMPGMQGDKLLDTVKTRWPATIRIVMSGYADQAQGLQMVATAHQYVSKPCDVQVLENIIERCLQLEQLLNNDRVRTVVGRIGKLPTMPKTYQRLQTVLADVDVSARDVAQVVESDPLIAAKVLQVANSAFFRLAKPMTRIREAVAYLGNNCVRNLVMSAEIFSQWHKLPVIPGLEPERLQAHSQATAAACLALARNTPLADDALLAGLLHDIGFWVLLQECPRELQTAAAVAQDESLSWHDAELKTIGVTHSEVGAYLLGIWGLPYPLVEALAFHHTPRAVTQNHFDLLAVLTVAHSLLPADEHNTPQVSDEMQPSVDQVYFEGLHPPYDWHEAQRRVASATQDDPG